MAAEYPYLEPDAKLKLKTYGVAYEYLDGDTIVWHVAPDADILDVNWNIKATNRIIIEHGWESWSVIYARLMGDGLTEWELDKNWDRAVDEAFHTGLRKWLKINSVPSY